MMRAPFESGCSSLSDTQIGSSNGVEVPSSCGQRQSQHSPLSLLRHTISGMFRLRGLVALFGDGVVFSKPLHNALSGPAGL